MRTCLVGCGAKTAAARGRTVAKKKQMIAGKGEKDPTGRGPTSNVPKTITLHQRLGEKNSGDSKYKKECLRREGEHDPFRLTNKGVQGKFLIRS